MRGLGDFRVSGLRYTKKSIVYMLDSEWLIWGDGKCINTNILET